MLPRRSSCSRPAGSRVAGAQRTGSRDSAAAPGCDERRWDEAQSRFEQVTAEHQALNAIAMPDGVEALDTALTDAQLAVQAAKDEERRRKRPTPLRERHEARHPTGARSSRLVGIMRNSAESSRKSPRPPPIWTRQRADSTRRPGRSRPAPERSTPPGMLGTPPPYNAAALAEADRLTAELGSLTTVTLPPGVVALDQRDPLRPPRPAGRNRRADRRRKA